MENKAGTQNAQVQGKSAFSRALTVWVAAAFAVSVAAVLAYGTAQQILRQSANWPQVQMAQDAARAIASRQPADTVTAGVQVDVAASLAPFVVVYDAQGNAVASSGVLNGAAPAISKGVLEYAGRNGEDRVSWTPASGVRIAAVVVPVTGGPGGYALAGRSLRETERTIGNIGGLDAAVWAGSLAFLTAVCLLYGFVKKNEVTDGVNRRER